MLSKFYGVWDILSKLEINYKVIHKIYIGSQKGKNSEFICNK